MPRATASARSPLSEGAPTMSGTGGTAPAAEVSLKERAALGHCGVRGLAYQRVALLLSLYGSIEVNPERA